MEQQLCVLLYSKYSQKSKKLMDIIKFSGIDFESEFNLTTLCVDNEDVRQRILNSKSIEIKIVPCILIVYTDGGVEKYEGTTAADWIEEKINSLFPQEQTEPEPIQTEEKKEKRKSKKRVSKDAPPAPQSTDIDDLNSEGESEEESEEESERDEADEIHENFKQPPASIRSGVGQYDVQGEFGTMEEPNRSVTRGIKSSTEPGTGGSKGDLMSAAMAMQKMREKDDVHPANPNN